MRKWAALLLTLLLACGFCAAAGADEARDVTVMIYLSGCDLESVGGAANTDILEMIRSGFDPSRVNVLLLTGGAVRWKTGFPADRTGLYRIDPEAPGYYTEEALYPLKNMGDPETLQFFLETCRDRYPAEEYMLILWDHGGGPLLGACVDRVFDNDMLTVPELRQALSRSGAAENRLSLIGFDACLMSSLEMAAACAPYADYMVASQELEPGNGWNYAFLHGIENDENPAETAERIIDSYFAASESKIKKGVPVTLACMDLHRADELTASLAPVFRKLSENLTPENFSGYSVSRQASTSVARSSGIEYDLVDLGSVLRHSGDPADTDTAAALEVLEKMVVYQRSTREELTGLTVYFPYYNKEQYLAEWGSSYSGISSAEEYSDFIRNFGKILTGEELTGWTMPVIEQEEEEPGVFVQMLTPAQRENFVSAELVVLNHIVQDDSYSFSNRYGGVTLDRDGALRAEIRNVSLYAADAEGNPLAGPLTFWERDGFFTVKAMVYHDGKEALFSEDEQYLEAVDIRLRRSGDSGRLEIVDAIVINEDESMAGRSGLDLSEWDSITFSVWAYALPESDGLLPPYDEWPRSSFWYNTSSILLDELDSFRFLPASLYNAEQFAYFEILDTQGERHASPLFPVRNERLRIQAENRMLLDDPRLSVRLDQLQVALDGFNPGVTVSFMVENRSEEKIIPHAMNCAVNGIALDGKAELQSLDPGESHGGGFHISLETLQKAGIRRIRRIGFQIQTRDMAYHENGRYTVEFSADIDLSEAVIPEERQPIGRGESGGLAMEVYGYSVDEEGTLILEVGLMNHSGSVIPLDPYESGRTDSLYVNGCRMNGEGEFITAVGYLEHDAYRRPPDLADGQVWYGLFRCPARPAWASEFGIFIDTLDEDDCFLAYGIQTVSSLEMVYSGFSLRIGFDTPPDYAGSRGWSMDVYPPRTVAAELPEAVIRIESVRLTDRNEIGIVLQWENRSGVPVCIPEWRYGENKQAWFNGTPTLSALDSFRDLIIEPGKTCRFMMKILRPEQEEGASVRTMDLPLFRKYGDTAETGPVLHIELGTPLEKPGDRTGDFTVSGI